MFKPVEVESVRMEGGLKEKAAGGMGQFFARFGLAFTLYMMLIMYGMATMRSVLEEKTSRMMEVLLSSVTAKELMAGKMIGVRGGRADADRGVGRVPRGDRGNIRSSRRGT